MKFRIILFCGIFFGFYSRYSHAQTLRQIKHHVDSLLDLMYPGQDDSVLNTADGDLGEIFDNAFTEEARIAKVLDLRSRSQVLGEHFTRP